MKPVLISQATRLLVILSLMLAGLTPSNGQSNAQKQGSEFVSMKFISVNEGLSSRYIKCGLKDNNGFLWFGTSTGLNRYDGKTFRIFGTRDGLLSDSISYIALADSHHLWVGLENLSMTSTKYQLFDLSGFKAVPIKNIFKAIPFDESRIKRVIKDDLDNTYFLLCNKFEIWKYNAKNGFHLLVEMKEWDNKLKTIQSPNFVCSLNTYYGHNKFAIVAPWSTESSWIITPDSEIKFNAGPFSIVAFNQDSANGFTLEIKESDYILNQSYKKGFLKKDKSGYILDVSNEASKKPEIKNSLPWRAIRISQSSNILFYNNYDGIYLSRGDSIINILPQKDASTFSAYTILDAFQDQPDRIWALTSIGVFQFNLTTHLFNNYHSKTVQEVMYTNQARGISVRNGTFLSGIWSDLKIIRKEKSSIKSFNNVIYSIEPWNNKYFIGSYNLFEADLEKKTFELINKENPLQIIWSLRVLNDSLIIMGLSDGIWIINLHTRKDSELHITNKHIPKPRNVYRLLQTQSKGLVAVAENGLFLINSKNQIWDYYGPEAVKKNHKLNLQNIYDMRIDLKGICWIATGGDGLWRWDWNKNDQTGLNQIQKFDYRDGISSKILYRIEISNENELYISSYNGLFRFNPESKVVYRYTMLDGLPDDEFNRISSCKGDDGRLYFGGLNGVTSFSPKDLVKADYYLNIPFKLARIEKISPNSPEPISLLSEYEHGDRIRLNPGEKMISLDFNLLDYSKSKKLYAYKIAGISNAWNYTDEGSILLSGLPYGNYNIEIKALTERGGWVNSHIVIPIAVEKPYYLQLWFLIFSGSLLPISIFLFYRNRNKRISKEKHKLELLVQKRTRSLSSALSDREILLKEIHHRVKNNLQVISGLLQLQQAQITDPEAVKAINEGQGRVSSIALIHQNLYQNDSLGSILFKRFVIDLVKQVTDLFGNLNHPPQAQLDIPELLIDIDTAVPVGLILNELLTNSCKYAGRKNESLRITVNLREIKPGHYLLIYRDNGPGLNEKLNLERPTTLGLKLITGLSEQLMGSVQYNYEQGSKFTIHFLNAAEKKKQKG